MNRDGYVQVHLQDPGMEIELKKTLFFCYISDIFYAILSALMRAFNSFYSRITSQDYCSRRCHRNY